MKSSVGTSFSDDLLLRDLKGHSIRGGTVTLTAQAGRFLLQLGATIVLARLLTPEDYGLFSIVISVTVFANLFKDLGLHAATVQSPTLDHRQSSALFWINVALGVFLALGTVIAAPWVAAFFREPRLTGMIGAMAITFIFYGISNQHAALLSRQMRFLAISVVDVLALGLGCLSGVVGARYGLGYWSLVLMQIVNGVFRALGIWIAAQWLPSLPQTAPVRAFVAFGGQVTGVSVLSYLNRNVDNLLIGFFRGARELGFYDKAYQLLLLPILQISAPMASVAIPVLSRLQSDARRYRDYFQKIVLMSASLGMPLVAFLFITADQTILLVLGDQWRETVVLFRTLAPAAFVDTFSSVLNWMLLSLGQTARSLRANFVISAVTLTGLVIGAHWGAFGVALAFSVCRVGVAVPYLIYASRQSPFHWSEILRIVTRPTVAALIAAGAIAGVRERLAIAPDLLVNVLIAAGVYGASYVSLWMIVPGGWEIFCEMLGWLKILRGNSEAV
jgi:PST family polysaccharide transporter